MIPGCNKNHNSYILFVRVLLLLVAINRISNNSNHGTLIGFVSAQGLAPPHPNWISGGTYESVLQLRKQERRRRLQLQHNIDEDVIVSSVVSKEVNDSDKINDTSTPSYTYIAKYISTEYCRYMTDIECQQLDDSAKATSLLENRRQIVERSRNLSQGNSSFLLKQQKQPQNKNKKGPVAEYRDAIQAFTKAINACASLNQTIQTSASKSACQSRKLATSEERSFLDFQNQQKRILRQKLHRHRQSRQLGPNTKIGSGLRVLVLLVRFKGHENRILPTRDYFETILNGNGISTTNPVGSMKEWFRFSSLGKYRVAFTVNDWQTSSQTESETAANVSALVGPSKLQTFFTSILTSIDNANAIDWANGYVDDFGILHHLVVLHSGYAAEMGPISCLKNVSTDAMPQNRIWSQGMWGTSTPWVSKDLYELNGFAVTSVFDYPACQQQGTTVLAPNAKFGQIAHEYNHGFGVPDLYDQDTDSKLSTLGGAAKFSLMSNGFGWKRDASKPGHHDPWTRIQLGWLTPIELTQNGYYAIQPSEISGQVYIIKSNFPQGEYLLIENRQPIKWDSDMPNTTGIVIWHIDENQDGQKERSISGDADFPLGHYMVSVVQADRLYDIEKGVNIGDENDFWTYNQTLGSGGDFPNTDSIRFGERKATGVVITITSKPSFIMTFQVQGIATALRRSTGNNSTTITPSTTTTSTVKWILSMLFGSAAMMGLLLVVFALL